MTKNKWMLHVGLLMALIAALAAAPLAGAAPAAQPGAVLTIGYLGGPETDTANGARLAIEQINAIGGVTTPDGTAYLLDLATLNAAPVESSLFNDVEALSVKNAVALLGPDNAAALTGANLANLTARGVPVLTGASEIGLTNNDTTNVIVRIAASEDYLSAALADYLTGDLGLTALAVVNTDPFYTAAVEAFEAALADDGIVPAPKIELADGSGLSAQIQGLLAANPEAVALWGADQDAVTLLRKLRSAGWTGVFAYRRAEAAARAGLLPPDVLEGVVGVTTWSYAYTDRASRNFLNDYVVAFGTLPGPLAAAGYDAVWVLRSAIGQAGINPAALSQAILAYGPQSIVGGVLSPAAYGNGDLTHTVMVYRLGAFGGPQVVALYNDGARQRLIDSGP